MILLDNRIIVIDDFFEDMNAVIAEAKKCTFTTKDALYHGYDADTPVPQWIEQRIIAQVEKILPIYFWFNKPKFRLAMEGDNSIAKFPHTDSYADVINPKFSMVIYLSDPVDKDERLGFFDHDSFGKFSLSEFEIAMKDGRPGLNDMSRWKEYCAVPIKKNRAMFFPAAFFHHPYPGIGYGKDAETGRLIMPVFIHVGYRPTVHSYPQPQILVMK